VGSTDIKFWLLQKGKKNYLKLTLSYTKLHSKEYFVIVRQDIRPKIAVAIFGKLKIQIAKCKINK
jgi:hypothetical protein